MEADNKLTVSYLTQYPVDAARSIERLPVDLAIKLFEAIETGIAASVISQMFPDRAGLCLLQMDSKKAAAILVIMSNAGIAKIVQVLEPAKSEHLIGLLSVRDKVSVRFMTKYPPYTIGALMDSPQFYLTDDISVGVAIQQIQKLKAPAACEIFIVDQNQKLTGISTVMTLLKADRGQVLRKMIQQRPDSLYAHSRIDQVVSLPAWQQYRSLPVIDHNSALVGVISYETVVTALRHKQYKIDNADLFSSVLDLAKLYWYSVAMLLEMLSGKRSAQDR